MFYSSLILSLAVALISASVALLTARINAWALAAALVIGVVASVLIAGLALALYPWTDLVVLVVALSAGVLLGRALPTRAWPLLLLLLILSALDITQIVLTSAPADAAHPAAFPPPGQLVGNFYLALPWGHFNIGIFDILVIAAMAEHWRGRRRSLALALVPGVVGIVLAFAFLALVYNGSLPLIPFLTVGWLGSLALDAAGAKRTGLATTKG